MDADAPDGSACPVLRKEYSRLSPNRGQEQENISLKRVVPENYEFGRIEIESPSGNPIRIYDLERTTQKRGSGVILTDYPEIMKELRESDMLRKLWEKYSRE